MKVNNGMAPSVRWTIFDHSMNFANANSADLEMRDLKVQLLRVLLYPNSMAKSTIIAKQKGAKMAPWCCKRSEKVIRCQFVKRRPRAPQERSLCRRLPRLQQPCYFSVTCEWMTAPTNTTVQMVRRNRGNEAGYVAIIEQIASSMMVVLSVNNLLYADIIYQFLLRRNNFVIDE